ncbi:MAG: SIR2 family protein [Candidatus Omnitrophota bacterium]
MSKPICVFVLGNGFAQGFGFPNLQRLWQDCLAVSSKNFDIKGYFEERLNKYPLSYFRKNNITDIELLLSVWSAYIANYERTFPDFNNETSSRGHYEAYLDNLCGHLLEYGDKAPMNPNYSQFKEWLIGKLNNFEFRFITLNYDLLLEKIISEIGRGIVYLNNPKEEDIIIRKLHGSVNWLKANTPHLQREDGAKPPILCNEGQTYVYNINFDYSNVPYVAFKSPPALIPPLVNKEYTELFTKLLTLSSKDLQNASFIIIAGYSLPDSDILIRRFLGNHSKYSTAQCLRFAYINSNEEHCVEAKRLLGDKVGYIAKNWDFNLFNEILDYKS